MLRFASSLILKPVLLKEERALVGIVESLVVHPDTGKLVGVLVREGFGKKHLKAIAEKDILMIAKNFYLVQSYGVMGDIEDIVRVKEVVDRQARITGNKVYNVSGKYLGKAVDYTISLSSGRLAKLYVSPSLFLGVKITEDLVIGFNQIVSIEKDKIVVEDSSVKAGSPVKEGIQPEVA